MRTIHQEIRRVRTIHQEIRRVSEHLTGRDHDYAAYAENPTEALLHETGHVVTHYGLRGALRLREITGRYIDVSRMCDALKGPARDINEIETLAWVLLVAKSLRFDFPLGASISNASFYDFRLTHTDVLTRVHSVSADSKVRKLASAYVRQIKRRCS